MRDSVVVYRNTVEVAKVLNKSDRLKFYEAVFDYAFYDKEPTELVGNASSFFNLTKPLIDANNKRYKNGCKGGRPKDDDSPRKDFGEYNTVILTETQWEKIVAKYGEELAMQMVITLDNWLAIGGQNAKQYVGKNNYGHFRKDYWVYQEAKKQLEVENTKNQPNWSV